jgi:hypothetical protein
MRFADGKFVDCKTARRSPGRGRWGMLCTKCHSAFGTGLGTGKGQLYQLNGNHWERMEG